jgi:hypothetical protein
MVVRKAHVLSVAVRIGTVRPFWFYYFCYPLVLQKEKLQKQKNRVYFLPLQTKGCVVVQW